MTDSVCAFPSCFPDECVNIVRSYMYPRQSLLRKVTACGMAAEKDGWSYYDLAKSEWTELSHLPSLDTYCAESCLSLVYDKAKPQLWVNISNERESGWWTLGSHSWQLEKKEHRDVNAKLVKIPDHGIHRGSYWKSRHVWDKAWEDAYPFTEWHTEVSLSGVMNFPLEKKDITFITTSLWRRVYVWGTIDDAAESCWVLMSYDPLAEVWKRHVLPFRFQERDFFIQGDDTHIIWIPQRAGEVMYTMDLQTETFSQNVYLLEYHPYWREISNALSKKNDFEEAYCLVPFPLPPWLLLPSAGQSNSMVQ